eukprot:gnl/TRDRNA2_/TRDRNA2_170313_c1_seq8.p1 gnl/TRDRNA2_/TRDRNA2_170313_c1~~gnl/TRDRNA2_/TRDRNA2_170313_c1_seq8.p1  ORF type:complete len:451 (+),score=47.55 gnl/TRDRNA2_/TRDRNA2_170313_c1_seq8:37-1353(+)
MGSFRMISGLAVAWTCLGVHGTSDGSSLFRIHAEIQDQEAAIEEVVARFDSREKLCQYWGWQLRPQEKPQPRIFYGTITGNKGQDLLYQTHFAEIYSFVHRIVALDPEVSFLGHPNHLSLNLSLPEYRRFLPKLRQIIFKDPGIVICPGCNYNHTVVKQLFKRPGKPLENLDMAIEEFQRTQIVAGFKNDDGAWELQPSDIVIIADSDEIPLRESLAALLVCDIPAFSNVAQRIKRGDDPKKVCKEDAKILLKSQVYEYYADCPTTSVWWHPDAILADCLIQGDIDTQDVRIGSSGSLTGPIAARHVHNMGMSFEDIVHKYTYYAESGTIGVDAGFDIATHQEMSWRACDPAAPQIGPYNWTMSVQPNDDFRRTYNDRGFQLDPSQSIGLDRPLSLVAEQTEPERHLMMISKLFWKGTNEASNPYKNAIPGNNTYLDS